MRLIFLKMRLKFLKMKLKFLKMRLMKAIFTFDNINNELIGNILQ